MAETILFPQTRDRKVIYESLLPQLTALVKGEENFIANISNILAALKEGLGFLWVGSYFTDGADQLVLGPFQGPVACTRINKGKGVCGTAWVQNRTIIVPDVDAFPGHIACSSLSKSEIVVPLRKTDGVLFGVLDIDSTVPGDFNDMDAEYLQQVAVLISACRGE